MEMKWTKWYAMTLHVIAYRSLELLFGKHTYDFNCFFKDFNCVFTQIRCLSRVLMIQNVLTVWFAQIMTFEDDNKTDLHLVQQLESFLSFFLFFKDEDPGIMFSF